MQQQQQQQCSVEGYGCFRGLSYHMYENCALEAPQVAEDYLSRKGFIGEDDRGQIE